MGRKKDIKHPLLSKKRKKRTKPVSKVVNDSIVRLAKTSLVTATNVPTPSTYNNATKSKIDNFNKYVKKWKLDDMEVIFKPTSTAGGGAFATTSIAKNTVLRNIFGQFIGSLTEEQATVSRSSVTEYKNEEIIGHQHLIGSVSLFNHACKNHANCITKFTNEELDFKLIQTRRSVKAGDELTITYDANCILPCRMCNK